MPSPTIYQIHTRPWLRELAPGNGRPPTLNEVPDQALDAIADLGMEWVWMLGVWQTGPIGRSIARSVPELRSNFRSELPDLREDDILGSPFAIERYQAHKDLGGDAALARFRERLRVRGLRLMLDFVPNHTGPDCPWVVERPEFFVQGREEDLLRRPHDFRCVETVRGPAIIAHGKDPYFPSWTDTYQLCHQHAGLRAARVEELLSIAQRCDGVRCDMAMLVLPDVFGRTWGELAAPADGSPPVTPSFWVEAIQRVRRAHPEFFFLAEAYWDLEWELQCQGFDATYDKTMYDRLRRRDAPAVRGHLHADPSYQRRSLRFLENHDEPRAASVFDRPTHHAAAVIAGLVPGPRLYYEGQFDGRKVRPSVQLARRPNEPLDAETRSFYVRLLALSRRPDMDAGPWRLLECRAAWHENRSHEQFVAFLWKGPRTLLVAVNYGPMRGQCYVGTPLAEFAGRSVSLVDLLGPERYVRDGDDLLERGLYLDMPEWGHHVFEVAIDESPAATPG